MPVFLSSVSGEQTEGVARVRTGRRPARPPRKPPRRPSNGRLSFLGGFPVTSITSVVIVVPPHPHLPSFRFRFQGLDTPLAHLLPGFQIKPPSGTAATGAAAPLRSKRPITMRALAMQVSGLPREAPESADLPANATMAQVELDVLRNLAGLSQIAPQFSQPHYSNLGLALVGRAVEKVVAPM